MSKEKAISAKEKVEFFRDIMVRDFPDAKNSPLYQEILETMETSIAALEAVALTES